MCDCTERSIGIYHTAGAATGNGTQIAENVIDPETKGNEFCAVSVINDTDQDIKFLYATTEGVAGEFIIPKSIKGFTRSLRGGKKFDNSTIYVKSLGGSAAAGNISINFGI